MVRSIGARRRASFGSRVTFAFTLIEMLVTIVLVSVALVSVMGGIGAITAADVRARDTELLQRLAGQKLDELGPVTDARTADDSGDFSDDGYSDVSWSLALVSTSDPNVDKVTVTATRGRIEQSLSTLIFVRPATTTTGATAGATP